MPYLLGIDIGASATRAAVCRRTADGSAWAPAQPVTLDAYAHAVVSGKALSLVGDDVPVQVGEEFYAPHVLVADLARWVVDTIWQSEGESPEQVAIAHPTGWGPGRVGLLRSALDGAGLGGVALVTRARAITESHQAAGRLPVGGRVLAVYRIGGTSVEASLVIPHGPGRLELLGSAELTEAGGSDLEDATPDAARAVLRATVDLTTRTALSCGVAPADLAAVLLAGGAAVHPLVAELLSAAIPAPVIRDDDPRLTVACGAALASRGQVYPVHAELVPRPSETVTVAATWSEVGLAGPVGRTGPVLGERPPRPPVHVSAPPSGRPPAPKGGRDSGPVVGRESASAVSRISAPMADRR